MAEATILCEQDSSVHPFCLPIYHLTKWLTRDELRRMASLHNIRFDSRARKPALAALFLNHNCEVCKLNVSLFRCPDSQDHKTVNEEQVPTAHKAPPSKTLSRSLLKPYSILPLSQNETEETFLRFAHYLPLKDAMTLIKENNKMEAFALPMKHLACCLTRDELRNMASLHNIRYRQKDRKPMLKDLFTKHQCDVCESYASVFENCEVKKGPPTTTGGETTVHTSSEHEPDNKFPPSPPSRQQVEQIVNDFCADTSPSTFEESGCAVCVQLTLYSELIPVAECGCDLSPLVAAGVTRGERFSQSETIQELEGPVIDRTCKNICQNCVQSLEKGKAPKHALANGLWLGIVPDELKGLTFAEKMMIARVRHNRAVVRVSSG